MKKYSLLNNVIGLAVFLVAAVVFLITAEPTASWWDCGEYIATAYKLEVGHPPGAPTFQLLGRFFSLFAGGDVTKVAYMVNAMSAISSALSILFLFWTITLLAKKIVLTTGSKEMTTPKMWAVFASGAIGALAYTFSDTFWFSAVEGEVYAMSSFFTAITFWAVLKWEEQADQKHSLRWLILITFLIGLAIGVHLLNLLAIPAIVYVYYFKKYPKVTKKGFIIAGIVSIVLLAAILYVIIPGIVILAGAFEVFFVNKLSMPFNSGTIIFFALLLAAIILGLIWSKKKEKPVINASILAFTFLLIGYSTFFILVIRANANTPINENEPKDAVALRAYLGREQYGSTPLFYGQYYTARAVDYKEGYTKYIKGENKYIPATKAIENVYDDAHSTIFPRMYSADESRNHILYYKYWAGIKGDRKPTFGENLKYFFRYQVNFMYWRYFMWNFAGRQNDIQGHYYNSDGTRDYLHGNWISGINFIDEMRLGPQGDYLPDDTKDNWARNTFFFLPLLLGLAGLLYHFKKSKKDTFIVFLLFFMTGLAIVIYLNQPPLQPRERDYAYAGSFYAFAIWIGLGVMGLTEWLSKKLNYTKSLVIVSVITFFAVPVLMAQQGWDDHDRSHRYPARDFARNYLNSCDKNAILITYGDNDTFPLWYAQEVEEIRTDIRVLNYTLSGMHWYVEQLYNTIYDSPKVDFTLPKEIYGIGNDVYYVNNRISQHIELKELMELIKKDPSILKGYMQGQELPIFPASKFKITLDKPNLINKGVITEEQAEEMPNEIRWEINSRRITRNELMLLDILATNNFERPIYVMNPHYVRDIFPPVNNLSQQEGTVYRVLPYQPKTSINIEKTYNYYVDPSWTWGNLNDEDVYVENPVSMNNAEAQRSQFAQFAEVLLSNGEKEKAKEMLDLGLAYFPTNKIPINRYLSIYADLYIRLGEKEKAEEVFLQIAEYTGQYLKYYNQLKQRRPQAAFGRDVSQHVDVIRYLGYIGNENDFKKLSEEVGNIYSTYAAPFLK